ncbi:MAG: methyltransferase domain-containing protein [Candidatus Daviesbacteria bacterium]|nr:methyltransferase domain-containing protein [Candidatus Daviesbacteria bacterium]
MANNERRQEIETFYRQTAPIFLKWSPDPKRIGLYAMHIGYQQDWGEPLDNSISALQMSRRIIELSEIKSGQVILDAGCGVGTLAFEIKHIEPKAGVYGIDISRNHIHLASQYEDRDDSFCPIFSIQDYEHLAFRSGTFDRIIFCESFIHSQDKTGLIQESSRILKSKGIITIADIFMHPHTLTKEEVDIIAELKTHMHIPNITHIQELVALLLANGFSCINPRNITENVVSPVDYHDSSPNGQSLDAESSHQDIETLLAGLQRLLRKGKAGYYILTAQKNKTNTT